MRRVPRLAIAIILAGGLLVSACGGSDPDGEAAEPTADTQASIMQTPGASSEPTPPDPAATVEATDGQVPIAAPTATIAEGSILQIVQTPDPTGPHPPNELGQIPILEYHHLGPEPAQFVRTPEQFRADLQWLYDNDFYVVNLHDILAGDLDVPAGKRPVALTFDDSPASQFSLIQLPDGRLAIDPTCAVGIMELFFTQHPDFGRGGHFSVLPGYFFDWDPETGYPEQTAYIQNKFEWLIDNGYEIGNHTLDHVNLAELSDDEIKYQLAEANDAIHAILPGVPIKVITLPYGMYPHGGDDTLLRGFQYEDRRYVWEAALLVGANPTVSPISTEYNPYAMARIQAFDEELDKWFAVFQEQPGILYVSDGDPNTVTVPEDVHPWLVGTLDMSKIGDRELVRY